MAKVIYRFRVMPISLCGHRCGRRSRLERHQGEQRRKADARGDAEHSDPQLLHQNAKDEGSRRLRRARRRGEDAGAQPVANRTEYRERKCVPFAIVSMPFPAP